MFFWWLQVFFPLEQNQNHRTDHKHAAANCNHGQAIRKTHAFVILSGHTGRSLFTAAEIGWIALLSVLLSILLSRSFTANSRKTNETAPNSSVVISNIYVSLLYPRIRNAVMCINTVIRLCMETAV